MELCEFITAWRALQKSVGGTYGWVLAARHSNYSIPTIHVRDGQLVIQLVRRD